MVKYGKTKGRWHMDFVAELQKLLHEEEFPPVDPLAELAQANAASLEAIQKSEANLTLQVEEIYDIIKDFDANEKEIKTAGKRENLLLGGLVAMSDLLDVLLSQIQEKEHTSAVAAKFAEIINYCGLEELGFVGERLDPKVHTVSSAEFSDEPPETIISVPERGYAYRGKVLRKATVILSKGAEIA